MEQTIAGSATLAQLRESLAAANAELEAAVGRVAVLHHDLAAIEKDLASVQAALHGAGGCKVPAADWALAAFAPYLRDGEPPSLDELEVLLGRVAVDLGERAAALRSANSARKAR